MKKYRVLFVFIISGILGFSSVAPATGVEIVIDDFESYSTGGSYTEISEWVPSSDCYPGVNEEEGNQFLQSSSCYSGQATTKPFEIDTSYINGEMKIQFSGAITNGSGNNSSAELYLLISDGLSFGFGLVNWPSGGYDHQLRIRVGGELFAGANLSAGVWYDIMLNIDWTFSTSEGFGLACLKYKEKKSSEWITDLNLCNIELNVKDISAIDSLQLRMDGISSRLGRMDDIIISGSAAPECEGGYSEADLIAAKEKGRQACIADPASCGIEIGKGYDEGYSAGYVEGQASCDIGEVSGCATFDLFTNKLKIPCLDMGASYWLDLMLIHNDPVTLELSGFGSN